MRGSVLRGPAVPALVVPARFAVALRRGAVAAGELLRRRLVVGRLWRAVRRRGTCVADASDA